MMAIQSRLSASQIRKARQLLKRTSAWLALKSHVDFKLVLMAESDHEIANVELVAILAVRHIFEDYGIVFTSDGECVSREEGWYSGRHRNRRRRASRDPPRPPSTSDPAP